MMGVLDDITGGLSDIPIIGSAFQKTQQAPRQPGVNPAAPPDVSRLRKDPTTGQMIDPVTGIRYNGVDLSPIGAVQAPAVVNPNVATQVAGASANSQAILAGLADAKAAQQQALGGQTSQIHDLNGVIAGTAPSVAGTQLQQTLGQIVAQQESAASGQGGQSAFAARRAANANIGAAQTGAAQTGAINRANEINAAQGLKASTLQNIAGNASTEANTSIGGAATFGGQALNGEMGIERLNNETNTNNANANNNQKAAIIGDIAGGAVKTFG
jgi:hypothetical protein